MQQNFKLIIEYDGSAYHGWQRQLDLPTVQETIEVAIAGMARQKVTLHGSGRTDSGVHARHQVASFSLDTRLSSEAFHKGINSLTPRDIVILSCTSVPLSFHPRFDAVSKVYEYIILNRTTAQAIGRQYAWHIRKKLLVDQMQAGAALLQGKHDFAAFEATGSPRRHSVRDVMGISVVREIETSRVVLTIEADGFLRCMVRNIVGTLVDLGLGKISLEEFQEIFLSRDRTKAGATAPAHGLFLKDVRY